MASSGDRRAATVLLCVALLGVGVRWIARRPMAPGAIGYHASGETSPNFDSVVSRSDRLRRPLGPDERIDVDRASAEDLLRLPRIGPELATRIVAERERDGPFGSLVGLSRVSGIGPATLETIARHTSFSGLPRAGTSGLVGPIDLNNASMEDLTRLPGIGRVKATAILEYRRLHGPFQSVDDLAGVAGIGPRTVERLRSRLKVR